MSNAIEFKNVSKSYNDFTLDNVSFSLPTGCILGLVGENGAGKSTTINLLMNIIKKDSGQITVLGCDNTDNNFLSVKEDIGVVLDEGCFPEAITAEQTNRIMQNTYKQWDENEFNKYLKMFDLPSKKPFKEFSRGMKMKLSIAVALSHNAKLLVLDEPTSGLDPIVRDEIVDVFNDFTRDESHSILISSHIISDLEKICDYFAFIHKGRLVLFSEKDRILEEYGIVHCDEKEEELIPKAAVAGIRKSSYSSEILVKRSEMPTGFKIERPTFENIILFMVRGERK